METAAGELSHTGCLSLPNQWCHDTEDI